MSNRKRTPLTLHEWREAQGLTQDAAAEKLGLTQGRYSQYERGTGLPRPKRAVEIAAITGVPFENLMGVA